MPTFENAVECVCRNGRLRLHVVPRAINLPLDVAREPSLCARNIARGEHVRDILQGKESDVLETLPGPPFSTLRGWNEDMKENAGIVDVSQVPPF